MSAAPSEPPPKSHRGAARTPEVVSTVGRLDLGGRRCVGVGEKKSSPLTEQHEHR